MNFKVGEYVQKPNGAYRFHSVVVSVFQNRAGETRLVCESTEIPGLLHIFSPSQMKLVEPPCRGCGKSPCIEAKYEDPDHFENVP